MLWAIRAQTSSVTTDCLQRAALLATAPLFATATNQSSSRAHLVLSTYGFFNSATTNESYNFHKNQQQLFPTGCSNTLPASMKSVVLLQTPRSVAWFPDGNLHFRWGRIYPCPGGKYQGWDLRDFPTHNFLLISTVIWWIPAVIARICLWNAVSICYWEPAHSQPGINCSCPWKNKKKNLYLARDATEGPRGRGPKGRTS